MKGVIFLSLAGLRAGGYDRGFLSIPVENSVDAFAGVSHRRDVRGGMRLRIYFLAGRGRQGAGSLFFCYCP